MRGVLSGLAVSCLIALIYVVTLVATMPADALRHFVSIPRQITALYGTVWHGRADLMGDYVLNWDHRASHLIRLRATVDARLSGDDTQLTGTMSGGPFTVSLHDAMGRAGPGLLALVPGLAVATCTTQAVVDVAEVTLTRGAARADGRITVDAGTCTEVSGRIDPVPPLDILLDTVGNDARAQVTTDGTSLAEVIVVGDRRLILTLQPDGSALIPGLPTGAPITLEYPF